MGIISSHLFPEFRAFRGSCKRA